MTSLITLDIITIVTNKSNELLKEIHTLSLSLYADFPDNSVSQGAARRQHRDDRERAGSYVNNAGEEQVFLRREAEVNGVEAKDEGPQKQNAWRSAGCLLRLQPA